MGDSLASVFTLVVITLYSASTISGVTVPRTAGERRDTRQQEIEESDRKEISRLRSTLQINVSKECSTSATIHGTTLTFIRCVVGKAVHPSGSYDEEKLSQAALKHLHDMQKQASLTQPPRGLGSRGAMSEQYREEVGSYQVFGGAPRIFVLGEWAQTCEFQEQSMGYRYSLEHWVNSALLHPTASIVVRDVQSADFVYLPFCMSSLLMLATTRLEMTSPDELHYLAYQGLLLERAIHEIEDRYLLPGINRVFAAEAFQACWRRGSCRFLIASIYGRHVWQSFGNFFGNRAIFITHAGLSDWTSQQAVDLYWSGLSNTSLKAGKPPLIQAGRNIGCRAACSLHCQLEPLALLPDDIVLPWTVAYAWGPRSSMFHTRDLVGFFAGTLNSCSRLLLGKVFKARFATALHQEDGLRNATLVFPSVVKLEQHTWSELAFRSFLCLVPDGDSPNTGRLIEVIMHGCVPVIITNRLQPPLHEFINWRRIAFFVHEDQIPSLPQILTEIVRDMKALADMHQRLQEAALALDYTRGLSTLVFLALRKRAQSFRDQ